MEAELENASLDPATGAGPRQTRWDGRTDTGDRAATG